MIFTILFMPLSLILLLFEKSISSFFINNVYENDLNKYLLFHKIETIQEFQEKRYYQSSKVLFLIVLAPFINFNIYYISVVFAVTFIAYKKPYYKYKKQFNTSLTLVKYQFPIWLRQIQILLHNNNVINSLILSMPQAPDIIKVDLQILIDELSESPNNVIAFTDFMEQYNISEINRAMKLLYRCYIVDKEESAQQLNRMIASTTKWIRHERVERQSDHLSYFEWIGIIPLFGVTVVFMVIMANLIVNLFGKGVGI